MRRRGNFGDPRPGIEHTAEFELVLIDGDNLLHRVRGLRDESGLRWLLPRLRAWLPSGTRAIVMLDGHPDPGDSYHRRVATDVEFQHSGNNTADTALVGTLGARPFADRSRTVVVSDDRALGDRVRRTGGAVRRLDWLVAGLAAAVGEVWPTAGGSTPADRRRPGAFPSTESGQGMFTGDIRRTAAGPGVAAGRGRPGSRPVGIGGGARPKTPDGSPRGRRTTTAKDPAGPDAGGPGSATTDDPERDPWKPGRGATRKHGNPKRGHPAA